MRFNPIPLITICLLVSFSSLAQIASPQSERDSHYDILLKSGTIAPERNITVEKINSFNRSLSRGTDKSFVIIQFDEIPTQSERLQLMQSGIELLDYVPHNAYTATITGNIDITTLTQTNARGIVELTPYQKMSVDLGVGNFRPSAVKVAGTVDVRISFPKSYIYETVVTELRNKNIDIISSEFKDYRILSLRVSTQRLSELALYAFIEYVESVPGEDKPLSDAWTNWGRDGIRASILSAPLSQGGKNLKGSGIVIGIGDDADFQLHPDFTGRRINRADALLAYHGTHVAGIAGGAGIVNEIRSGMAPKSTLLSQVYSKVFSNAPAYVTDYGMVITNNSYGYDLTDCSTFGLYNFSSRILDSQAISLSNLISVFAAGNSGNKICAPFPDSFRTVIGGYQSAKNIISVGNAIPFGESIFGQSSRGPVRDGRLKPEVVAMGSFITSTVPGSSYGLNTGTSMSSPAIAGGLALLYEKYKLQNAGANPKNGLMKALVCNGADDWGNPGPDFTHGFGVANFSRAVDMLENNRFSSGNILPSGIQTIPINVPSGIAELKVMLYWNDPAAAPVSYQTLVNDLDLEVETPGASIVLPLVLDTAFTQIKNNAHNGIDNINNIEQVVIKNPVAGDYTIKIKGTNITQNPSQDYFIVYDLVPVEIKLLTPFGGETYQQGENVMVRWDSYGEPQNTFTLEYSTNNGASWTILNNNIDQNKRQYFFTTPNPNEWFVVPAVSTDVARVRITRNGTGLSSTSLPFVISDTIFASLSPVQCEGYFSIDWTAEPAATGYEVMMLKGDEMVSVATVSNSTFTYSFSGLSKDSVYWASVRPLIGASNSPGRRAIAVSRQPNSGTCAGTISDNDIKLDSIISPAKSGRLLTTTALGNSVPVTVRIKNLDDSPTPGNITVSYILNGGSPVAEVINPAITGGGTFDHTFAMPIDLSASGTNTLIVTISQAGDPVLANDSLTKTVKQLLNPSITGIIPSIPFIDNFDASPIQSYNTPQIALTGLDRYDFVNSNIYGRIRTFINTGIAYSGNRAITLDASIYNAGVTDSLTGTYNLATYNSASDDIRLDFRYKNHGQNANPANKVWIRGTDADNWIEAYDLYANQNEVDGTFKLTSSIELSDLLQNAIPAQNFSTSTQIRWGQYGQIIAADNEGSAGYTFDDIRLYEVTDDIQLISIDTPIVNSCNLSANTPVKITIRNSTNTIIPASPGIPVRYQVNSGGWVNETITTAIPANSNFQYTFTTGANLATTGSYLIEAEVQYATDDYPENDTMSRNIFNTPLINVTNTTPYLQNFEMDNGSWYSAGKNISWEYGTPGSYKINRAASGSKAWKTRLAGNYNDFELSYLYSPCFDISTMSAPTLSFSIALDLEDCGAGLCDGAFVEYSVDGISWNRLGANGEGTNWYNKNYTSNNLWSVKDYNRWHVASIPLSVIPLPINTLTQLRFRFVMSSDASVNKEGMAIDDIHLYSNPSGIYDGITMVSPVTENIPGSSGWVDFLSGGKLVASVNSPVSMGSTDVQAYIFTGTPRVSSLQFYHDRNITIKPTTTGLADSAIVRFYFLDSEMETLINAAGCSYCTKPSMAYELGVTKYSDPNDNNENGTLSDNASGIFSFINSSKTKIIPFDKGYYAEFKVKDFSEFWLSDGGLNKNTPLPLKLISFTATKVNTMDVLTAWITTNENNVNRFEIEVARGNQDYQLNRFVKIGTVSSLGNSTAEQRYSFTDIENNKSGVRYYRLKMIDIDGSFTYSPIRPVVFTNEVQWQVYPNPSTGIFNLVFQVPDGETVTVKIFDATGKVIKQYTSRSTGFLQKLTIDLQESGASSGLYMLEAETEGKKQFFKLLKQ